MTTPTRVVVSDANILINLCHAGLLSLLERLPGFEFVVSTSPAELTIYAELRAIMGSGEASCIALAQSRGLYLASDERRAFLREVRARISEARLLTTPGSFGPRLVRRDALRDRATVSTPAPLFRRRDDHPCPRPAPPGRLRRPRRLR